MSSLLRLVSSRSRLSCKTIGVPFMGERRFSRSSSLRNEDFDFPVPEETQYDDLVKRIFTSQFLAGIGHSVAVIQPRLIFGPNKHDDTAIELMLAEAKALVESLPNWSISDVSTVAVKGTSTKYSELFGSGNMEKLEAKIRGSSKHTAVFINLNSLRPSQFAFLHDALRLPIYDRYTLILEIFRTYAKTKEAKLQVALAELQYLKAKLGRTHNWEVDRKLVGSSANMVGQSIFTDDHRMMLQAREAELKRQTEKVKLHRQQLRTQSTRENIPVVSIVGYTNAGKTSLIRCLTQDKRLVPENRLFATLSVSVHQGRLPSRLNVLYADTIGFISDIPTNLIAAFTSMLDDVRYSDLVVHIRDMSHPDRAAQKKTVMSTLRSLDVPKRLFDTMIEVWNKIDLVKDVEEVGEELPEKAILTSCVTGEGLRDVEVAVDKSILSQDDVCRARFLVPNGGEEIRFLYSETTVRDAEPTTTGDQLIVTVISKRHVVEQFLKRFGNLLYRDQNLDNCRNSPNQGSSRGN